jgi:hypothetical protein
MGKVSAGIDNIKIEILFHFFKLDMKISMQIPKKQTKEIAYIMGVICTFIPKMREIKHKVGYPENKIILSIDLCCIVAIIPLLGLRALDSILLFTLTVY